MDPLEVILPGDCLVYRPTSPMGWVIAVKTWARAAHVEGYFGRGWSVASRNGKGVNFYSVRVNGLCLVLRPKNPLNMPASMEWFHRFARGQKYDWMGLLCFTLAVRQGAQDRMFCSEFLTRWYRQGGFHPVAPWIDADHVAPAQFVQSPEFLRIWNDGKPV